MFHYLFNLPHKSWDYAFKNGSLIQRVYFQQTLNLSDTRNVFSFCEISSLKIFSSVACIDSRLCSKSKRLVCSYTISLIWMSKFQFILCKMYCYWCSNSSLKILFISLVRRSWLRHVFSWTIFILPVILLLPKTNMNKNLCVIYIFASFIYFSSTLRICTPNVFHEYVYVFQICVLLQR